ncbi:ARM repeat-containing protein [Saccharata proteae CBS 121410]|uniref:ARM repeat-containing protein n=1 Tax=Saccharata proteae CBS 121410 TaxID=1314787 RepID=A0A9P4HV34_9PEZI|nr:ARM repeat-containing protein [Saccharata proteae CBS 121410]
MASSAVVPPTSIAEVEELVKRLYQAGTPAQVQAVEKQLQQLQKSQEGWILADTLLSSSDANVRFFGALTFTVKLKSDWQSLDDGGAHELLLRLITWLVKLVFQGEKDLVVRKLCTTLVQYYLTPKSKWVKCIRHIICSFANGAAVPTEDDSDLAQYPPVETIIGTMHARQLLPVILIAGALIEELSRTAWSTVQQSEHESKIMRNCKDVVILLQRAFSFNGDDAGRVHEEAFDCMTTWALFVTRNQYSEDCMVYKPRLQTLIQPALRCAHEDAEHGVEGLSQLLRRRSELFEREHLGMTAELIVNSQWGQEQLAELMSGESSSEAFVSLALAFASAVRIQMVADASSWPQILSLMHQLVRCPGYAVEDEEASVQALEFWSSYADDTADGPTEKGRADHNKVQLLQAAEGYWAKACVPPKDALSGWDQDTRKAFSGFRTDIADFFENAFAVCDQELLSGFVRLALNSLQQREWLRVEASLFCMVSLAESVAEEDRYDSILAEFLGSSLFTALFEGDIPPRTQRTAVDLLGRYSDFFIRHTKFLVSPLNFLFSALSLPQTANNAARSIASLSSTCRTTLTSELDNFMQAYKAFVNSPTANQTTKPKVMGGIAAIVQALPSKLDQARYLDTLLQHVEAEVKEAYELVANPQYWEQAQQGALTALHCLAAMGKSLQSTDDQKLDRMSRTATTSFQGTAIVDLTAEDHDEGFWNTNAVGVALQQRISQCLDNLMAILSSDGEIIEGICDVFKAGFLEQIPGPFVLPSTAFVSFISRTTIQTPRLPLVLSTTCCFFSAHAPDLTTPHVAPAAHALLMHIATLTSALDSPSNDPEISHSIAEALEILLRHSASFLFQQLPEPALRFLLNFTIACILAPEPLPKRAGCDFWFTFLTTAQKTTAPGTKHLAEQILAAMGPTLARVLIFNVAGGAQRSDLNHVVQALRVLVTAGPQTKGWLGDALMSEDFPAKSVDGKERERFRAMLMAQRGKPATRTTVLNFWATCKGLELVRTKSKDLL